MVRIIVFKDGKWSSVYTSVIWTIVNLDLSRGHGSNHVGVSVGVGVGVGVDSVSSASGSDVGRDDGKDEDAVVMLTVIELGRKFGDGICCPSSSFDGRGKL